MKDKHVSAVYFGDAADPKNAAFNHTVARTKHKFTYFKADAACASEYGVKAPGIAIFHGPSDPIVWQGEGKDDLVKWMNTAATPAYFDLNEQYAYLIFGHELPAVWLFDTEQKN